MWIYDGDKKKFKFFENSDPHLLLSVDAPEGCLKYIPRIPSNKPVSMYGKKHTNWNFVYFGVTKEECLKKVNAWANNKITALKEEIAVLEENLVKL